MACEKGLGICCALSWLHWVARPDAELVSVLSGDTVVGAGLSLELQSGGDEKIPCGFPWFVLVRS